MARIVAVIKRLWNSTFVICALLLVAFNCLINDINPLKLDKFDKKKTLWGTQVAKIPPILASKDNPDVVIVGASGILFPSVRCDDAYYGRQTRYDPAYMRDMIWTYSRSDYFQHLLSRKLGKQVDVVNTAVGGCMASDQYLILKKYLASGKKPKLILLFSGPKDFIDNQRKEVTTTATYTLLADYPTRIQDIVENKVVFVSAFQSLTETALKAVCTYYNAKGDYRDFLTDVAVRVTGHPKTFNNQIADKPSGTAKKLDETPRFTQDKERKDLALFKHIYRPIDVHQVGQQSRFMDRIVSLACQENIPIALTFMPLTPEHTGVLGEKAFADYKGVAKTIAHTHHIPCFDPVTETTFVAEDFEDSAHLNGQGGKKFFECLTDDLAGQQSVVACLNERRALIGQH